MRARIVIVVVGLVLSPSLAHAQRAACGGHRIEWIGGPPRAAFDRGPQDHEPPSLPEPEGGFDERERELWDALIYDAHDRPHPDPEAMGSMGGLPLKDRRTLVMHRGETTSFRICIQSADESYTGERLERYSDPDWWARQVERFTNSRWAGDIEVEACTEEPPRGWVYVREGRDDEVDDTKLAHAKSWRLSDPHGIRSEWVRSEIVWHSADMVRDTDEEYFEKALAHELGHILGLWHTPAGSGFIMEAGGRATWDDRERSLSQWAYVVGPNVQYPGLIRGTDVSALPLVGLLMLAGLLSLIGFRGRVHVAYGPGAHLS